MRIKLFARLSAFLMGLVLLIAVTELAMRATAATRGREHLAKKAASELLETTGKTATKFSGPPLKIVVLGESTSATTVYGQKDIAWPEQLRRKLQAHFQSLGIDREVQMINLSRSGVSSTLLVDHLTEVLQLTVPDAVITMTGINDSLALKSERGFFLSNSYVARLLYWSYISLRCPGCYRLSNEFVNDHPVENESRTLDPFISWVEKNSLTSLKRLEAAELEYLRFKAEDAPKLSPPHANRSEELDIVLATWLYGYSEAPSLQAENLSELRTAIRLLAVKYFEGARRVVVTRKGSIKQYCFALNRLNRWDECLALVKEGLRAGVTLTPDFFVLAISAGAARDPELKATVESLGYSIDDNQKAIEATKDSYRRLLKLKERYGFQWFAMQYPKGSVAGLGLLLNAGKDEGAELSKIAGYADLFNFQPSDQASSPPNLRPSSSALPVGVHLISNENFNLLVNSQNEADYFTDLFARASGANFGHTTEKGHALIADNVFSVLVEALGFAK